MATKEDILEQIMEEYLISRGYFVQHNLKFLPRKDHPDFVLNQDSNHSDIDVVGIHPLKSGPDRVWAVSCKSWQGGFNPASEIAAINAEKKVRGRTAWKAFRELCIPKWSEAFVERIAHATGSREFTYVTAVSRIRGDCTVWETHADFQSALGGNPIKLLDFETMVLEIQSGLSTTVASTEVGRMLQMFQAAGLTQRKE
jgi:hypothetical protein